MKKFFGFGSDTPPPPPPPLRPVSTVPKSAEKPAGAAPAIIGRWKEGSAAETTEFHADGTVTEKLASGETIRGRYVLSGDNLKINLAGVPKEISFRVAIKGDGLDMIEPDGGSTHYQRAK